MQQMKNIFCKDIKKIIYSHFKTFFVQTTPPLTQTIRSFASLKILFYLIKYIPHDSTYIFFIYIYIIFIRKLNRLKFSIDHIHYFFSIFAIILYKSI